MAKVVFKYGTRAEYDALTSKDSSTLYFLTDTGEIYRGSVSLARGSHFEEVMTSDDANHAAVIARGTSGASVCQDDIFVVKELIADDKYSYTSYIYDKNGNWKAMDGNYNAENVYFDEDLVYTKQIGELPAVGNSGSGTISSTGKNVKEVLATILAKKNQPSITQPAVSLTGLQSAETLEVGSTVNKSGTMAASLSAGSYSYGPATGITASSWSTMVKQGNTTLTSGISSSLAYSYNFVLGESAETITFQAEATHGAGTVAKDNLGGTSDPVKQIDAGTKTKGSTITYTPFRKFFYGVDNGTGAIDSALIRSLTHSTAAAAARTLSTIAASSKANATRVIVAIPNDSAINVTKVLMPSAMNVDATANFVKQSGTVDVAGANGTDYTKAYKVWVYQPAALDSTETYSITLG